MKIKNLLVDVRVHIAVAIVCLAVMIFAYIESSAEKISDMPVYGMIAAWVFGIILVGNVSVRLFLAWILYPIVTLFTRNRK